jgi:hypothetical protein
MGFHTKAQSFGMNFGDLNTLNTLTDARLNLTYIISDWADTMRYVSFYITTPGVYTADNENRIGIYTIDTTSGTCTLVASTVSDGNLWKASAGLVNVPLSSYYVMPPNTPHYIASVWNASATTTAPIIYGHSNTASSILQIGAVSGFRLTNSVSAQSTLPSTFNLSSTTQVSARFWYKLY